MLTIRTDKEKVMKLVHPCRCRACENSCNFGSGAFIEGEVKKLAEHFGISEKEAEEKYTEKIHKFNTTLRRPKLLREEGKPYGKCIFYENGCKIHDVKPFECKVAMGCKPYGEELITWFDLNFFLNPDDPESVRQYKLYLNAGGKTLPGAEIERFATKEELDELMNYEDLKEKVDWDEYLGIKEEGEKDDREPEQE